MTVGPLTCDLPVVDNEDAEDVGSLLVWRIITSLGKFAETVRFFSLKVKAIQR